MRRRNDRPIYLDETSRPQPYPYLPELGPMERYPVLMAQVQTTAVIGACGWMMFGWHAPVIALVAGAGVVVVDALLWGLR